MKINQKIPEGWGVKRLDCIGNFISGIGFPEKEQGGQFGIPFYKVSDMNLPQNSIYMKASNNYVTDQQIETMHITPIRKKAILFAKIGAAIFLERKRIAENFLCDNNMMCFLPFHFSNYLKYAFDNLRLSKYVQVGALPSYSASDLSNIKLLIPPLPEQEKIAEILGTWDLAIEKLTALIEQKKLLKKGLMQRLLTGKQRLPGFSAPWNKVKLGEITCQISKNVGDLKIQTASISSKTGFVSQTEKFGRDISGEQYSKYTLIEKGDFSYNKGNSKTYPQGCAYRLKDFEKIAVPNAFISFKVKENILYPEFIEQFFIGNFHGRLLRKVITSSVRNNGLLNLNTNDFFGLPISLPPLPEQNAIANILSKADEEITLLTRKLSALKEQKTGLMQKLLTGQIRVKVN